MTPPTIHATAVLIGEAGVLIRGRSGAGKTTLALALVTRRRAIGGFAALVADDRVEIAALNGRLVARAPAVLSGLVEMAGRGILAVDHEPAAVIRLVVDLEAAAGLPRMPDLTAMTAQIEGIAVPRQAVPERALDVAAALTEAALAAAVS